MGFQRPLTGNTVRAEAEIDSYGKNTLFASARILDSQGQICARAQGVVRLSKLPWASGDSPAVN
jgi:acyl-coenzyme A thioesterase PaaI-like protein